MNLLPRDEWDALFRTFEHTAFRLEVRDRYNVPSEQEELRKFLAGEGQDREWWGDWIDQIKSIKAEGKLFERVRVVSVPLSDYSRFGYAGAATNNAAGEEIRYLARDNADGLPDHDFWLFDSRKLVVMHFDDDDRLLGGEVVADPAEIVKHNYWRDLAWHRAVKREDFVVE